MAAAVSFTDVWTDGRRIHAIGTITFSGNYAAGGDSFDIKAAKGAIDHRFWKSNKDPLYVDIRGKGGFVYEYDAANKKVKVRGYTPTSASAGVIPMDEIAAAAYPAGVTGDVVSFYAVGKR